MNKWLFAACIIASFAFVIVTDGLLPPFWAGLIGILGVLATVAVDEVLAYRKDRP